MRNPYLTPAFLLFAAALNAQNITGRWLVTGIELTYTRKHTQQEQLALNNTGNTFNRENKGTTIYDYKSNGILTYYSLTDGDTLEYFEYKYWVKNKQIVRESPGGQIVDPESYEIRNEKLIITSVADSLKIKMVTTCDPVPGSFRREYDAGSYASISKAVIPSLAKKWTIDEIKEAALVILDLESKKICALPHHFDSSFVFLEKICNTGEMDFLTGKDAVNKNNVYALEMLEITFFQLVRAYELRTLKKTRMYYTRERTLLLIAALRLFDRTIEMKKELNMPLNRSYKQQMKNSVDEFFKFMYNANDYLSRKDLCLFYDAFAAFYSKNLGEFDKEVQGNFEENFERVKKEQKLPCEN